MAMRITQGMMYSSFVSRMNMNLSAYMESNIQSASQKRVNRPSDDPVSAGRILSTRADLSKLAVYEENIEQAMGWLNLADSVLTGTDGSVTSLLSQLQTLAQQGATGTYDSSNREQAALTARQLFEQLITLANTTFEGRHIFAGHKVDSLAYQQHLGVSVKGVVPDGTSLDSTDFHVISGDLNTTVVIQPVGPGEPGDVETDPSQAEYRYSTDGGDTWVRAVVETNDPNWPDGFVIKPDTSDPNYDASKSFEVYFHNPDNDKAVTIVDTDNDHYGDNGTWLYIRPTALYLGDDNYSEVSTAYIPNGNTLSNDDLSITGNFTVDTMIRIDEITGTEINYSYSVDDGKTWLQSSTPQVADSDDNYSFIIPGGTLKVNATNFDAEDNTSAQFVIHPHRADINFQMSEDDYITVNNVGLNIFGGYYDYLTDDKNYPVGAVTYGKGNLFEAIGNLVAALETNDQQGCQEALEAIDAARQTVLTQAANIGGRENRLISQQALTVMRSYAEQDNLSFIEDVDFTELMTRLSQQQIAYNSVLKSSSMIMQMSLVNFL